MRPPAWKRTGPSTAAEGTRGQGGGGGGGRRGWSGCGAAFMRAVMRTITSAGPSGRSAGTGSSTPTVCGDDDGDLGGLHGASSCSVTGDLRLASELHGVTRDARRGRLVRVAPTDTSGRSCIHLRPAALRPGRGCGGRNFGLRGRRLDGSPDQPAVGDHECARSGTSTAAGATMSMGPPRVRTRVCTNLLPVISLRARVTDSTFPVSRARARAPSSPSAPNMPCGRNAWSARRMGLPGSRGTPGSASPKSAACARSRSSGVVQSERDEARSRRSRPRTSARPRARPDRARKNRNCSAVRVHVTPTKGRARRSPRRCNAALAIEVRRARAHSPARAAVGRGEEGGDAIDRLSGVKPGSERGAARVAEPGGSAPRTGRGPAAERRARARRRPYAASRPRRQQRSRSRTGCSWGGIPEICTRAFMSAIGSRAAQSRRG